MAANAPPRRRIESGVVATDVAVIVTVDDCGGDDNDDVEGGGSLPRLALPTLRAHFKQTFPTQDGASGASAHDRMGPTSPSSTSSQSRQTPRLHPSQYDMRPGRQPRQSRRAHQEQRTMTWPTEASDDEGEEPLLHGPQRALLQ